MYQRDACLTCATGKIDRPEYLLCRNCFKLGLQTFDDWTLNALVSLLFKINQGWVSGTTVFNARQRTYVLLLECRQVSNIRQKRDQVMVILRREANNAIRLMLKELASYQRENSMLDADKKKVMIAQAEVQVGHWLNGLVILLELVDKYGVRP